MACIPVARFIVKLVSETLAECIDKGAIIVGENLTMVTFGCGLVIVIGNSGDVRLALLMSVFDLIAGIISSITMSDSKLNRALLRASWLGCVPC